MEGFTRALTRPITSALARALTEAGSGGISPLVAPVIILLGQSLNNSRGTQVLASDWTGAYMPVDGVAVNDFSFFSANNDNTANAASFASAVPLVEGASGQSPCVGIGSMLEGRVSRAYIVSLAVGARPMDTMMSRGMRPNIYAAAHRLCEIAVADGFIPRVYFYSAHGEADAGSATPENTYYDRAMAFYKGAQLAAAQAMGSPAYVAPVILTYPVQSNSPSGTGTNDTAIKKAIKRVGADLPGAIMAGSIYQWPCENDRVHPTPSSYVLRGEFIGKVIADHLSGSTYQPLTIQSVTLTGNTFVATFSHNIVRDTTLNVGQNLNTSNAEDGFEWFDNGTQIAISSVVYSGATATGTLASTPVGTLGQQELRIGCQGVTASLTAGHNNLPGSVVRKDAAGWVSSFDPGYTNYEWASPQAFKGVT